MGKSAILTGSLIILIGIRIIFESKVSGVMFILFGIILIIFNKQEDTIEKIKNGK